MTSAVVRVLLSHVINVHSAPCGRQPSYQANSLGQRGCYRPHLPSPFIIITHCLMDRPINCFDILDWLVAGVSLTTGTLLWYTAMEIADSRPRVIYVPSQRHVMSVVCDISIACDVHSVHKNCMCWTVTYSVDKLWHSCQFSGYFLGEPWLADWLTFRLVFFLHVLKENFWW